MIELFEHQEEAVAALEDGNVLYGEVGSGKSITALAYADRNHHGKDIYVITTAKKRDTLDWQSDAAKLGLCTEIPGMSGARFFVDSWNNIGKYRDVEDSFFIFDEQRVVGTGAWVKSFIRIGRRNPWILLSATPGDTWMDYAPVFIANGFFAGITQFKTEHVVYAPYVKFPKIVRYLGVQKLERLRSQVLVEMPYQKHTERVLNYLDCGHDEDLMKQVVRRRWHVYEDRPLKDVAELFRVMRRVVNSDPSRIETVRTLLKTHPRLVIFYNFNYELELLRELEDTVQVAEWNGHQKDELPPADEKWVYLVQYMAGSEGWNCTSTDAMILYSLTYSYKSFIQAQGRIDRLDTPFKTLYYYILASNSRIDKLILNALKNKKSFNERRNWAQIGSK